jgi:hypothetical protein
MKKTFLDTLNVLLSPLLLPPFHISGEKKTLTSTPSPSTVKKKENNQPAPTQVPPSPMNTTLHPGPPGPVKSNCSKLQPIKKVTKSNKPYPFH